MKIIAHGLQAGRPRLRSQPLTALHNEIESAGLTAIQSSRLPLGRVRPWVLASLEGGVQIERQDFGLGAWLLRGSVRSLSVRNLLAAYCAPQRERPSKTSLAKVKHHGGLGRSAILGVSKPESCGRLHPYQPG